MRKEITNWELMRGIHCLNILMDREVPFATAQRIVRLGKILHNEAESLRCILGNGGITEEMKNTKIELEFPSLKWNDLDLAGGIQPTTLAGLEPFMEEESAST